MRKVVIAEDEMLVRMGIEASLAWNELDLEVAASVADGERALECCEALSPDILLTDIRMPKLDGITLLRRIRGNNPRMRVIVITCIEDFDVLHNAMELGITGYLLKATMTPDDLRAVLLRALAELGDSAASPAAAGGEAGAVLYASFPPQTDPAAVKSASAAILEKLSTLGFWTAVTHSPQAVHIPFYGDYNESLRDGAVQGVQTEFRLPMPADIPDFDRVRTVLTDTMRYLTFELSLSPALLYHIYDGSARKMAALPERASILLNDPYFSGGTMLFLDTDFRCHSPVIHAKLSRLEDMPVYTGYRTGIRRERAVAHLHEAEQAFAVSKTGFESALLAFAAAVFGAEGFLPAPNTLSRLAVEIPESASAEEAMTLLEAAYPNFSLHPVYGAAIEETIRFIRDNLTATLLLPTLAKRASLSPNYYALLFKSAVGLSVTEFIARLRLERACDLLIEDQLSIQEIARACGFADVPYFSRFFKQYTGLPPRRWKNRHENAD